MSARSKSPVPPLPAPGVAFADDFVRRLEALVARVASARERRDGPGRSAFAGTGEEFVGYRPYRSGEDLRNLDWNLLARLDQPFVRVQRRETSERWTVLLDASASMGLGAPGKLQRAAEIATGVAFVGLRAGASVRLFASGEGGIVASGLRRRAELRAWLALLESLRAGGSRGIPALLADPRVQRARAGRWIVIGDLLDLAPGELAACARPGLEIAVIQVLAPHELAPEQVGSLAWIDPERGERLELELDPGAHARYGERLEARLESWRESCTRRRIAFSTWSSERDFEDAVQAALGG